MLNTLLKSRHEALFDLRWNGKFDATACDAKFYTAEFDFDVSALQTECCESKEKHTPQRMVSNDDVDEELIDPAESGEAVPMLFQLRLREEKEEADRRDAAARTIQHYFKIGRAHV
mgnify:FL=1